MFKISGILKGNWVNSRFLAKNIKYILLVVVLSLFYINNKYKAESIILKTEKLKNQIIELKSKSSSDTKELMNLSTEIELEKRLIKEGSKLRIQKTPAIIINRNVN